MPAGSHKFVGTVPTEPDEIAGSYLNGVAAERERCIKIAERVGVLNATPADEFERGLHSAAQQIVDAISIKSE